MYQFTSDNKIVGYAIEPTYIKKLENGRYGLCAAYEAEGIVAGGKPYAIRELDDLPIVKIKTISDIKSKLRAHRGISKDNRKKLLDEYIMRHY